jgi:hypothetical protein
MTTIKQFVDAVPGYSAEQMLALGGALDRKLGKNNDQEVSKAEFDNALATHSPQAPARADILFVGFKAGQAELVASIAAAFDEVRVLVDAGLVGAGLSGTVFSTPYETLFGTKALRSGASYPLRHRKVVQVLTDIRTGLADRWVVEYKQYDNDVASWSGGTKVNIGKGFKGGGKFAAGVLIHEMGHRKGLVDVCTACRRAQIRLEHFQGAYTTELLDCADNDGHGKDAMVIANTGHFIGNRRTKLLATQQKNLAVWNADSYRWYCYRFFKDEVQRGAPKPITW